MIERTQRSLYSACRASQAGSSSHWRKSPSIRARTTIADSATEVSAAALVLPITAAYCPVTMSRNQPFSAANRLLRDECAISSA